MVGEIRNSTGGISRARYLRNKSKYTREYNELRAGLKVGLEVK